MKAIINLDKVKYPDVITIKNGEDVLENGAFFAVKGLDTDKLGRDTYKIAKLTEGCKLGFLADVALMYDETKDERDYELAANKVARAYRPKSGQGITISKKHVHESSEIEAGTLLEVKPSSYQLQTKSSGKAVAEVLEVYNFEGQDSLYIEFI